MTYQKGSIVDDQDYDSLIDKYNAYFASTGGLGLTKKAEGEIVTRNDWFNLWQKVFDTAVAQNRVVTVPFHPSAPGENPFSDAVARNYGYLISALPTWGAVGDPPAPVKVSFTVATGRVAEPTAGATTGGGSINENFVPGTYSYTVPNYSTLSIDIAGGGGGGGGSSFTGTARSGRGGGASQFHTVTAYGGSAGLGTNANADFSTQGYLPPTAPPGPDSGATGGDQNLSGGGGAGGAGSGFSYYEDNHLVSSTTQGGGSAGGRALKTWAAGAAGAPAPGTVLTVISGAGGFGAQHFYVDGDSTAGGGDGGDGYVKITGQIIGSTTPAGSTQITFRVGLDGASAKVVTVNYATADGTATAGSDYEAQSGTLTFQPGETYKDISINILYDTVIEPDETFVVNLSSPVGATIGTPAQAVGTIIGATNTTQPPPPPPPVDTTPGEWQGYYLPRPDLPGSGRFFGQQYFAWKATAYEPTPPPDRAFPYGFTSQGQYCQSDGNCQGGSMCPCNGLMSYGNPYNGDPVLTCFPGKNC